LSLNKAGGKPDYGNWIRRRILKKFLLIGGVLLVVALLPIAQISPIVRIVVGLGAAFFLVFFLYLSYVYWQFSERGGGLQRKLHRALVDKLMWDGHGQALDIGTGNGAMAIEVARKFPQASVIGSDLWDASWEYSKATCDNNARLEGVGERVKFEVGSAATLPYKDQQLDAVVSHFVFHEVDGHDKRDVLREALRTLRRGGAFALQDMFLDKGMYGEIPDLLAAVRSWGIADVQFVPSSSLVNIPPLLKNRRVLGNAGVLYGHR
jgi:SAM-dependent methyltransferase